MRAREAKSAERKAAEARDAEARAEAKRAREAECAQEAERAEAKRKEAAAPARGRTVETRKSSRSRTPGGGVSAAPAAVLAPTGPIDSRELRATSPDLTPEQQQLLALVKEKYGIPEDMSIGGIVEASRRMMAMQAKRARARSSSGARSSTA